MTLNRKIQMAALAVLANGVGALMLTTPAGACTNPGYCTVAFGCFYIEGGCANQAAMDKWCADDETDAMKKSCTNKNIRAVDCSSNGCTGGHIQFYCNYGAPVGGGSGPGKK